MTIPKSKASQEVGRSPHLYAGRFYRYVETSKQSAPRTMAKLQMIKYQYQSESPQLIFYLVLRTCVHRSLFDITDPPTRWCHIASGAVTLAEPDALKCPVCPGREFQVLDFKSLSHISQNYIVFLFLLPSHLNSSHLHSSCHSSPPSVPHPAMLSGPTWPCQLLHSISQQSGAWKRTIGVSTPYHQLIPSILTQADRDDLSHHYESHKQEGLKNRKDGTGKWKFELASNSEAEVSIGP